LSELQQDQQAFFKAFDVYITKFGSVLKNVDLEDDNFNNKLVLYTVIQTVPHSLIKSFSTEALWWGEMAPLPRKSPDLGNSSPVPRALMYVVSLRTFDPSSSSASSRRG
jgi:hypothetical protein